MSLQGEGDKAPKIRTARPVTIMRYEGTRKRRRAAMGDYNWSVGERVDAWIRDRCVCCLSILDHIHAMQGMKMITWKLRNAK